MVYHIFYCSLCIKSDADPDLGGKQLEDIDKEPKIIKVDREEEKLKPDAKEDGEKKEKVGQEDQDKEEQAKGN